MDEGEVASAEVRAQQFTEMFRACYGPLLAFARRRVSDETAQDVVAEVFLAAWRSLEAMPPAPLPWLYRAAQFAISNQRRAITRRGRLDDRARLVAINATLPDHADQVLADQELAAAFRALKESDREVIRLAAWDGLSATDAATVLGCTPGAFKVRLHRARQRLAGQLGAKKSPATARDQPAELSLGEVR
jgi:RNA polymerase sigma factor (sigma-70 family)